jgi:Ca2+-binding EF-hand superfamily protein/thiol-disulfide isomerase/thioredoxin
VWLSLFALAVYTDAADRAQSDPPADNPPASLPPEDELTAEADAVLTALRAALPADSEARVMLEDIVQGRRLGPNDGWFRVAVSQTRFDWPTVAGRYDTNADVRIDANEFGGPPEDFRKLDRDGDGAITQQDLAWNDHALAQVPGALVFRQADRDGNGKLTSDEWARVFQELDRDGVGYVTQDDLRQRFPAPTDSGSANRPDRPSRSTLILGLARQEIGSLQAGPGLNDPAPDFTLASLAGPTVTLSQEVGARPIVLVFGNFTCGPFRSHAGDLERLYRRYGDRAKFFVVYVREAHPSDGWWMLQNQSIGIDLTQPTSDQQRCDVAGRCQSHLQLTVPFLVDTVADAVGAVYSGMPDRLYLIDSQGRVAFKSGRGPFGFRTAELEQALVWLLAEQRSDARPSAN